MPQQRFGQFGTPAEQPTEPTPTAGRFGSFGSASVDTSAPAVEPDGESSGSGYGMLAALAGALGLGVAAYATRGKTGMVSTALSKANALRQQLMLSGMAGPKSLLGNLGATAIASAEEGSLAPLKALFSRQTFDDAVTSFKTNKPVVPGGTSLPNILGLPGRIMGSLDEATQGALVRGGLTGENAERAVLQSPLGGQRFGTFGNMMQSPAANYVFPFRRTPFNQLYEGLSVLKPASLNKAGDMVGELGTHNKTLAGVSALGAAHGAATSDEDYPVSLPMGIAAASRYGLPYGLSALAGRALMGGKGGGGIGSNVLPVSEYGVEAATDPLSAVRSPGALRALRQLGLIDNPNIF